VPVHRFLAVDYERGAAPGYSKEQSQMTLLATDSDEACLYMDRPHKFEHATNRIDELQESVDKDGDSARLLEEISTSYQTE